MDNVICDESIAPYVDVRTTLYTGQLVRPFGAMGLWQLARGVVGQKPVVTTVYIFQKALFSPHVHVHFHLCISLCQYNTVSIFPTFFF